MMMTLAEIQASGRPLFRLFRPVVLGVMGHDRMATWWGFPVEQATCSIFFRCIWAFLSTLEPCQIFNIQIWLAVWPTLKVFWLSHGDGKDIVNDDADDDGLVAALLVDVGEYFLSLCLCSFISWRRLYVSESKCFMPLHHCSRDFIGLMQGHNYCPKMW